MRVAPERRRSRGSARRRSLLLVAACAAAALGAGTVLSLPDGEAFPHAEHAGLFPACEACHAGVPQGQADAYYSVTPADCAACHDGRRLEAVEWSPRSAPRASNLEFSHPEHSREVLEAEGARPECGACHRRAGAERRMEVAMARAEACLGCHAHDGPGHLASGVDCAECHRPLADAEAFSPERIAAFPAPPDHQEEDFLWTHGDGAEAEVGRCAVCHARESCARCHLNADRLGPVAGLPPDRRVADLVADEPGEWPEPPTHRRPDWLRTHGAAARADVQACATCHSAPSCEGCHGEARLPTVAALPRPGPGRPAGVRVGRFRPPGHTPDFSRTHGSAAATGLPSCDACHAERECAACHRVATTRPAGAAGIARSRRPGSPPAADTVPTQVEQPYEPSDELQAPTDPTRLAPSALRAPFGPEEGGQGGRFHPPNFLLRHGAEAFAAREECAECHSREAFCRSCHAGIGMAAEERFLTGAFHDGQPDWLLAHGRAARQNMDACASCHQQTSCLRCHSARAGWGVNPHGPGFDAARVGNRSRMSCSICHFSGQLDPP